jgi:amidase
VTGLKPTWGRVSRHGVFPLAETLDHIGPMCRSAADTGAMLAVLAGADPHDPTAVQDPVPDYLDGLERGLQGVRIGVDEALSGTGADPAVRAAVDAAMKVVRDLGAELRPIRFPEVTQIVQDWIQLCAVETAVAHEATYPARKEAYGPGLAGLIEIGRKVSGLDYQKIAVRRLEFRGRVAALFTEIELLLVPAQLFAAPTLAKMATLGEDPDALAALLKLTCPFDMTGSPAITLPAGFTAEGGPVAIQFIGRHLDEALLVQAGHAWQRATDWHRRHPQL